MKLVRDFRSMVAIGARFRVIILKNRFVDLSERPFWGRFGVRAESLFEFGSPRGMVARRLKSLGIGVWLPKA